MSTIALPAALDGDQAAAFLPQLRRQLQAQSGGVVVLDASGVQRFDSATLALLLECRRWVQQGPELTLQFQGLPAGLLSMAHVYGIDGLLGVDAAPASTAEVMA